jgi:hypothetical protein
MKIGMWLPADAPTPKGARRFEFKFGKVTYKKGAPKNLPRWVWQCGCGCGIVSGPFKTLREAERDAEVAARREVEIADAQIESQEAIHH